MSEKRNRLSIRNSVRIPILDGYTVATFISFTGIDDHLEHFAIQLGTLRPDRTPLVRIHSECMTGDVFGSQRCDCGLQLNESLREIHKQGGYLIYLRQEGRGIGLYAKFDAYVLQDRGLDTFEANRELNLPDDLRTFDVAAEMLKVLDCEHIRLLTNNPDKVKQLRNVGIKIAGVVPTHVYVNQHNYNYLAAKANHAQHTILLSAPSITKPMAMAEVIRPEINHQREETA